jgi:uncharacterized protein (TIGR02145 family)
VGWHVPTDADWTILTSNLGGESEAGGKLKETGTLNWEVPNEGATNESGFNALPGAFRYWSGMCANIGYFGFWWTASEYDTWGAWHRYISFYYIYVYRLSSDKDFGYSVRCIRN